MTDQQHPTITPPRELVQEWIAEIWHEGTPVQVAQSDMHLATRSVQWGYDQRGEVNEAKLQQARDQELEACCKWLDYNCPSVGAHHLRNDRRPKPPSLAEQGLEALRSTPCTEQRHYDALFDALVRLKQLEDSDG